MRNTTAEEYEAGNLQQVQAEHDTFTVDRYTQFSRLMPDGHCDVLDVGCSTGRGGDVIAARHPSSVLWGLDVVQSRLDALPASYLHRINGLSTQIPIENASIDFILAGEFLEHLTPHDVDPTLFEFHRVLRIGGRVLLTTPNPNSLRLRYRRGTVYEPGHLTQHFARVLRLRLRMHGFSRVRIRGTGRASNYLGTHVPFLQLYGSYLISAEKI